MNRRCIIQGLGKGDPKHLPCCSSDPKIPICCSSDPKNLNLLQYFMHIISWGDIQ